MFENRKHFYNNIFLFFALNKFMTSSIPILIPRCILNRAPFNLISPIAFLKYVLTLLRVEKLRSPDATETGIVAQIYIILNIFGKTNSSQKFNESINVKGRSLQPIHFCCHNNASFLTTSIGSSVMNS